MRYRNPAPNVIRRIDIVTPEQRDPRGSIRRPPGPVHFQCLKCAAGKGDGSGGTKWKAGRDEEIEGGGRG
jgi:hypothetical protein